MTRDEEQLEAMHQMRTSMQMLDSPDLPEAQKNKAIENLFDSYQIYHSGNVLTPPINELKKSLIDSISLKTDEENLPQTLQKIQNLKELWNFSYFKPNDYLNDPFFSTVLEKISGQIAALQQSNNRLEQIKAAQPVIDSKGVNELLEKANGITSEKKDTAKKQKTADGKQKELKQFVEAAFAKRQKLPLDQVNITKIELQEIDGKPKLILTDDKRQTSVVPIMFTVRGKKPLFGGNVETENGMKPLYARLLKEKSIAFVTSPQKQQVKKETQSYTAQNFCEELGVKLSKAQAPELSKELKAYNILLSNSPKDATNLLQKLKTKYTALEQEQEKEKIYQAQEQIKKNIDGGITTFQKGVKKAFDILPTNHILALAAPASGQNQDMLKHRQHFTKVISLLCRPNALSYAHKKMLFSLRNEETFWKNINDTYYTQIKEVAQDNFYQTRVQQMFDGSKKTQEVLKEVSTDLSPDLAKKILARSVIVYGLGNALRKPAPQKTNKILDSFGYQINLKPIKVEEKREITSKETTFIMRCLADGLFLEPEKAPVICVRLKKHLDDLQQIFGKEKNYNLLITNPLNNKVSEEEINQTPYQTANMKIGLLAALTPEISKNIDFSEKLKRSLPQTEQKQWDVDDYLFTRYMNLFFDQNISPADKKLIQKLKQNYDWDGFKKQQKQPGTTIYQDFANMNKKTETIIFNALTKGKLNECNKHHNEPLKFAVVSTNPVRYNNNLVTSVQSKPWQEDWHQLQHLSTIEGTDMVPSYCMTSPNKNDTYDRKDQGQLQIGDTVYYESLQIKDKNGLYHDLIPERAFYINSNGQPLSEPHPTQKALAFHNQKQQNSVLEI